MSKNLYTIKPKITKYNGVIFRSRLEAKWACMFDKLGWHWVYEPCEINGYNPDFIIKTTSKYYDCNSIIVEVKPSVFIDDNFIKQTFNKYKKIKSHVLILDENPFVTSVDNYGFCKIGYGFQYVKKNKYLYDAEFVMKSIHDICTYTYIWDGMIGNEIHRKKFLNYYVTKDFSDILLLNSMWIESGNLVQFQVNNNIDKLSNLF